MTRRYDDADTRLWIGVDPGLRGGVAALGTDGAVLAAFDMPITTHPKAGKTVDARRLPVHRMPVDTVVIEEVEPRPANGPRPAMRQGMGYGIIIAAWTPDVYVRAARWKRDLGVTADKQTSIELARQLWPADFDRHFCGPRGGVRDGRVEAALIAHWAINHHGGTDEG